jgi:hypothetical protein
MEELDHDLVKDGELSLVSATSKFFDLFIASRFLVAKLV